MQSHPAQQMSSQGPPSQPNPPTPNQQQPQVPVSAQSSQQQQQQQQQQQSQPQQQPSQVAPPHPQGGPMPPQSQPPPPPPTHPSQMTAHPNPYIQYPQHHYFPHHPQQMHHPGPPMPHGGPVPPHGPPPQHPHAPPHPQQHMMQPHPGQQMAQGPPHQPPPSYYQPIQHAGPPPQQHGPPHQMGPPPPHPNPYMQYPQHHYYPHHPQQMQPPPPPHVQHPGQQMSQGPPPPHHQSAYYQPVQHGPPPQQQHGPHPMAQNPYIQYSQHHYYPHHPQQMQHGPHGPPPHHPHHPQHMMQPHPSQQMVPHGPPQPHHPQYYQPAQPPPPPPPHGPPPPPSQHSAAPGAASGPPPMPAVQGPPPPPPHTPQHASGPPPPQHASGPPPPQQLPPPASPHHPPSRTHTPQQPPPPSQTPTRVMPQPPITPASPSIAPKIEKKEITFPKNSVEATKPVATKRRKFTSKDVTDIEAWRLLMCLKSGLLAESSWAIDVLSILLNDDSTSAFFSLSNMPGMLEAVLEHFKCCLNEIFKDMAIRDTTLKPELSRPVSYSHWQEGNGEDTSHIQVYFDPQNFIESSRRCICLSTILRNLSFIPSNDVEMSKHPGLLLVLGKILMYKPDDATYNELESPPNEWHLLNSLREDTLVIISNISSSLDLSPYNDKINLNLLKGLLHWACCSSTFALDPFPPPSMVSPQRLALESLAKLSIIEGNVDLILATPPWHRLDQLFEVLTNMLSLNEDQTVREFSLVLLSNLAAADSGIARRVALTSGAISRLVSFIERSINDQNESNMTTQDMLRRAASTLKYLSQLVDNHQLFSQHQQRLLNLVMSGKLDQEVAPIIADVIFEISLSY